MSKYILKSNIIFREEEEGAFLYNHETEDIKIINETARDIIRYFIVDGLSKDDTIAKLNNEYSNLSEDDVFRDFDNFIASLYLNGYISQC
ncbi:MAG: hypothetical protein SFH39_05560 [Candidatus Magnetobacterium sp. LHC-1]